MRIKWIVLFALVAPLLVVGRPVRAVDYPTGIFDADNPGTRSDATLTQGEVVEIQQEIEAIETELEKEFKKRGLVNHLSNGSLEDWTGGSPDSWTLSGTGASAAQVSDGQDGSSSAEITAGTAVSRLSQNGIATISGTQNARFRGRPITLVARVKTSAANTCRVRLDDGVTPANSLYHTGGGAWESLSISFVADAAATLLKAELLNDATDSAATCRFDSVVLREGYFKGDAFHAAPGSAGGGTGDITAVGSCASGACFQSETQNKVLAAPATATGPVAPRTLVAADIPAIPASKISDQHSGTNVATDLEEEAHAAEHNENAADELLIENLGTGCAAGKVVKSDGGGGLDCADDGGGGGGSAVILDFADDGTNESAGVTEIAVVGDTNAVFSEPAADKLLIDAAQPWPKADALAVNPSDCAAGALANAIAANGNLTCTAQHAGTDITADLEEEAHAAEHEAAGADPITVENMKTSSVSVCALEATGAGGVQCTTGTLTASSTHTLTNKTIDAEATGNVITIPAKLVIMAAACSGATATSGLDLPSTGAATAVCSEGTNTRKGYLEFSDTGGQDAYLHFPLPQDWVGNIDLDIKWLTAATAGNFVLGVRTACVADGETADPAFNAAQSITDAAKGTANQMNDATLTNVTTTGCAAGEMMFVKLFRDQTPDTITGAVRLDSVMLTVRRAM